MRLRIRGSCEHRSSDVWDAERVVASLQLVTGRASCGCHRNQVELDLVLNYRVHAEMELNIGLLLFFLFFSNGTFPASGTHICEAERQVVPKAWGLGKLHERQGPRSAPGAGFSPDHVPPRLVVLPVRKEHLREDREGLGSSPKPQLPIPSPSATRGCHALAARLSQVGCKMSKTARRRVHEALSWIRDSDCRSKRSYFACLGLRREITRINAVCFLLLSLVSPGRESELHLWLP